MPERGMAVHSQFVRDGKLDRDRAAEEIRRYLDLTLRETQLAVKFEIKLASAADAPQILVDFSGADDAVLIENQAELLLALEHIALRWLHLEPEFYDLIRFDCAGFRAMRLEELKLGARVAAQRVRETHEPFHFNPMAARERRLIHLELNNAQGVRTMSEGVGERRHLVIYPTEKKR